MKHAVVFIADGSEEIETLTPVDYLRRAGVSVSLVAVGSKTSTVVCSHSVSINADMTLEAYVDSRQPLPDALVVPGGMPGASNIAAQPQALSLIKDVYREGKLLCAICASPAVVLARTDVLRGKKWTCYPQMEENAQEFRTGHQQGHAFVHDGNLITGRGPGAAEEFSMEIVRSLVGDAEAERIKQASMQR